MLVLQTNHVWKVSHEGLKPLHRVVDKLKQKFDIFQITHIFRLRHSIPHQSPFGLRQLSRCILACYSQVIILRIGKDII